ncbi:uncharacterized protein [Ptychodera flava]
MRADNAICLAALIKLLCAVSGSEAETCPTLPCENNGRCVQNGTSYECVCAPGFIGKYCHDVECKERKIINTATDVKSPFYPKDYPIYKICEYSYETGLEQLIMLNSSDFELEMSEGCTEDYLSVFDGSDETGPHLGTYCGNKIQAPITTTGRRIFLKFRSDGSITAKGFHLVVTPIQDDGTPLSTRTDYTVQEDDETKARGGKLYSHRDYPNGSELVNENYELEIRNDRVYNQTYVKFTDITFSEMIDQDPECNIESYTGRHGSDINDGFAVKVNGVEECCQLCNESDGCVSYGFDTRNKNCWLKDAMPRPTDSPDFHSGIITPCDNRLEMIKIFSDGKLIGIVCQGHHGNGFVSSGRITLEMHISDAIQSEKGFKGIYTLFYMSDGNGKCRNENDYRCNNGRCIPKYLRDDYRDHSGKASRITSASVVLVSVIVSILVDDLHFR